MNKHCTVLYVSLHAGELMLRRFRREKEGGKKQEVCLYSLSSLLLLSFLPLLLPICLTEPLFFSLSLQRAHTQTHGRTVILSVMREKSAPFTTQRGFFYSCERLLCKTRVRARSLEVSFQLRILLACLCACVCSLCFILHL